MACQILVKLNFGLELRNDRVLQCRGCLEWTQGTKLPRADYKSLLAQAEAARLKSENARLAMELHRNEHGC
jgi:hypothetical protein